ncbi:survival motor neuron protein [Trichonephila inaurata madagascariensis]|uniref:Survival motor neuron protein n=1 Tax=Trichonephila inaurata madagascariensis TaxID=2747483 RepID=A0A8X6XMD3_9ARAC|nr:survival motor neuron protein [Trichonephila inaurata madagascariensis]
MREVKDFRGYDWDDTELVRAYNKALKMTGGAEENIVMDDKKSLAKKWKVGSNCCAKFSGDNLYYEAKIISIYGDFCTIEFWGYNDIEKVAIKDLEESAGKRARKNQIKSSAAATIANLATSSEEEIESEVESTVESVRHHAGKNSKKNRRGNPNGKKNEMYDVPHGTYDYSGQVHDPAIIPAPAPYAQQYSAPYYAAPPPPTVQVPPLHDAFADIAPMLVSWYWAGYHAGMYANQEGARFHAQAPGPRGRNHCQHAHRCCHC